MNGLPLGVFKAAVVAEAMAAIVADPISIGTGPSEDPVGTVAVPVGEDDCGCADECGTSKPLEPFFSSLM